MLPSGQATEMYKNVEVNPQLEQGLGIKSVSCEKQETKKNTNSSFVLWGSLKYLDYMRQTFVVLLYYVL